MNKTDFHLETPDGSKKVLLHTCCAPCSSAIVECLLNQGFTPVIFYSNANIYPVEEYERRRNECERYACDMGVEFVEDEYNHEAWKEWVAGMEHEPERGRRCLLCFKMRLRRAAQYAREHGITVVTTTLGASRWKSLDQIAVAGDWATKPTSAVAFWGQNWRKGGLQERRNQIIKEKKFYNQTFCGCEYSFNKNKKKSDNQENIE